jgi:tRNA(Ser,Leu) C12 N-acetylase TAN1
MAAGFDALPFNAVAISEPRATSRALRNLATFGSFRATPYRRVIIGWVDGDAVAALTAAWSEQRGSFVHIVRMTPLERVVAFSRDDVTEELCCALECAGPRIAGKTFHVRTRLRGLTGRVDKHAVDRALGGYLLDLAAAAGEPARVSFSDPDLILAIEVIGRRVGYGFLDRVARAVPLVRPR